MEVLLDYLSVTLSDNFTYHDWTEYAEQPVIDEMTGLITGRKVAKSSYETSRVYKHIILSIWGKDTMELAYMAMHHHLEPTRLDIKLDITGSEVKNLENHQAYLVAQIKQALAAKSSKRKYWFTVTPKTDSGEFRTDYFGGRSSDSQIRIYKRTAAHDKNSKLRIEFQLRTDLAKAIWNIIAKGFFSKRRMTDAMASLESVLLVPGCLGIDWQSPTIYELDREKQKVNSSRKDWIITQVLPAIIKEFNETGENLAEFIKAEFDRHFTQLMNEQQEYDNLIKTEYRKARIQHFKDILDVG